MAILGVPGLVEAITAFLTWLSSCKLVSHEALAGY
jgi:hypothetical protein